MKLFKQKVDKDTDVDIIRSRKKETETERQREAMSFKNLKSYKPSVIVISAKLNRESICFIFTVFCFLAPKLVTVDKNWGQVVLKVPHSEESSRT